MAPGSFADMYAHMDLLFLSEKIYKPMAFKHPFIVFAQPGILKQLREYGYKTFHPFIDESYDDEKDDIKRFDMVVAEIERLNTFTDDQWIEWQKNIKAIPPILFIVLDGN